MKNILITKLRDASTSRSEFRNTAHQLAYLLAAEAGNYLETTTKTIKTPISSTTGVIFKKRIILLPILRSGLILLPAFLYYFPESLVGFVGMKRDEATAKPRLYYQNLPKIESSDQIIILDPMIATGGTAVDTISLLIKQGITSEQILFVGIISAPEGMKIVHTAHPKVTFMVAVQDQGLTSHYFITPGLGDFGDRYFGTE